MRPETVRARELRRNMSGPEVMLWSRLKGLRARGYPFRRQTPYRGYFLDFACLSQKLVVEVDGNQHGDDVHTEHDGVRDRVLQRHGFRVLRFWTHDVRHDIDAVMDRIVEALESS